MQSPVSIFFNWGNRFDVKTKADWDFYLLIIMFLAFMTILFDNLYQFIFINQRFSNLGWAIVMLAILYFQYFGLKGAYEFRKMINAPPIKTESPKEMEELFKDEIKN